MKDPIRPDILAEDYHSPQGRASDDRVYIVRIWIVIMLVNIAGWLGILALIAWLL